MIVAADYGINLQTGNSRKLLHAAAHLARSLRGDHGIRALARGGRLLRSLAAGNQINDVGCRQGRIGNIRCGELVERSAHGESEVVLLHGGGD